MDEYIPTHRADVVPVEPSIGPAVNDFLRSLTYGQLHARYISVYNQFRQESRHGGDIDRLQMAEVELAYPGLYKLIEAMADDTPKNDFSNGVVIGAVAVLSTIKSTIEIEEFEEIFRES